MQKTRAAFLILILIASPAAIAQEPAEDPEGSFYAGLEADTISLDQARLDIAGELGPAVATDLVVALCAPPVADEDCQGSNVFRAWDLFLEGIAEGVPVAEVARVMQGMPEFDEYLISGIAVYWCAPDPGPGCATDPFARAWWEFSVQMALNPNPADAISQISAGPVVAELVAASVCGEPTCFASDLAGVDPALLAQLPQSPPEQQVKQPPASEIKFSRKPRGAPKDTRAFLCSRGIIKDPKQCPES